MFFLEDRRLVFSASDLVTAAECEFGLLRRLDEKLGRAERLHVPDPMRERAAALGDVHEQAVLQAYRDEFGPWTPGGAGGVAEIEPAADMTRATLEAKHAESMAALAAGADVVFQASFFDGGFHGRADFLVRGPGGRYAVFDTKLARHAKTTALLQLAAYGDQLARAGFPPSDAATLILGTGEIESFSLTDLVPAFRERWARLRELAEAHVGRDHPAEWEAPGVAACGRCDYCAVQIEEHRDMYLTAGMGAPRRRALREAGVRTIDDLAALDPAGGDATLARLVAQARLQTGVVTGDGGGLAPEHDGAPAHWVRYEVLPDHGLGALPAPSAGDVYFDFEGDPLWFDRSSRTWGLEYLFGVIEAPVPGAEHSDPVYRSFLAHTLAEERQALVDFVAYIEKRRAQHPGMHVYHYAAYEKTALRKLSVRHGVCEAEIDAWLREGLLVDLYQAVRSGIRISERSYSIKKLEPLYMGSELRTAELQGGAASVEMYARFTAAREARREPEAEELLDLILEYNRDDCVSTLRLCDWLRGLAAAHPSTAHAALPAAREARPQPPADPDEAALTEFVARRRAARAESGSADERAAADDTALGLLAAAVRFHPRERKAYWWAHFDRLERPLARLESVRNAFIVEKAEVVHDWEPDGRLFGRTTRLVGTATPGSDFREGSTWFREFEQPLPEGLEPTDPLGIGRSGLPGTEIVGMGRDGDRDVLTVREKCTGKVPPYAQLPVALTEDAPLPTASIEAAQREVAREAARALPGLLAQPAVDLLRRLPPRTAGRAPLPPAPNGTHDGDGLVAAIEGAVRSLDRSYLAVQGPPGSGKTHVGATVIARLVATGWKVGVVGNSHNVVENLLTRSVAAGVPVGSVAKKPRSGLAPEDLEVPWPLANRRNGSVAALVAAPGGCLVGGTAWQLTGQEIPAGSLDLVVVDEAGQFSLANTVAVSRAAPRLLLLGDPQQLPEVSQGQHPEPVNESALGWLAAGARVLPDEFGYFLPESWRMAPPLCEAVSRLSYARRLRSAPAAAGRRLDGVPSGVAVHWVEHSGNATNSPEEAAAVVREVQAHVGLTWHDEAGARALEASDVLVVAPYNAQVNLIRERLDDAGLSAARVGTVDKFQGQEAVVVLVSMACSSPAEAPRGLGFLLNRNRINVAVSRAKWRAVVVRSPQLTAALPRRPAGLEELGAFIGLCGG
ncbi:TM0106 family RecB-like putative nuclease [Sinomonas mesophila]|uniref:TM0106 family RecB-like putative nuclease n=1 Tax=Sinomonas mesophila TaxID=1531955 RepID=UPI000984CB6F|nr:TM0106 family RecB-like putative nuclease [Sinomonas mesophila]